MPVFLKLFCFKQGALLLAGFCALVCMCPKAIAVDITNYFEPAGVTKTFRYSSTTESGVKGMDTSEWKFEGRLVQTHGDPESVNGSYALTVVTHSEGLKGFPTGYSTNYVQETDGYYSVSEDDDANKTRSLILPTGVQIGQTWKGSEFWDEDMLDAIVDISVQGTNYKKCLRINRFNGDRTDLSKKVGERQEEVAIFCPETGLIRSTVTNTINAIRFRTVTTIELVSVE